ncbi:hypothetical protein ZIOFF_071890 [Zingiber officinale]|uniref:Uncharacterized protein n=1 Tax=Zingiber officinale TaxID=94328 RepID=A0A8J5C2B4_ZINOF|nr:hypothetical protein ZIOFF_071890 [Zingiber officinale]
MEIPLVVDALRTPGFVDLARLLCDIAGAWASVALLLAGFAAFLAFLGREKLAVLAYGRSSSAISLPAFYASSGDDDDEDDVDSESPSDDDENEPPSSPSDECESSIWKYGDDRWEYGGLEMTLGGAVVRTWEGLGLGFDLSGGLISLVDVNRGEVLRSFYEQDPAAAACLESPAVVVSASECAAAVRVWDARAAGERTPAAAADWRPIRRSRAVGVAGAEGKVYLGGDDGVITDLRRGRSPSVVERWGEGRVPILPFPK